VNAKLIVIIKIKVKIIGLFDVVAAFAHSS